MKIKFKEQAFQLRAVEAVVDCFAGQPNLAPMRYRIDPGQTQADQAAKSGSLKLEESGFKNQELVPDKFDLLKNIRAVQKRQGLSLSEGLTETRTSSLNLDVEMETGTGKTYCYIRTIFELNRRFGWTKFIIVVPSIAIREGAHKSLEMTAGHFHEIYRKKAKFFIYDSKQLHDLENFSSDAGINIMIINVQAFNSRSRDNRRIYEELDSFQTRRPIDVIKTNHPILILDEPQKMEGAKTLDSLKEFNPLFIVRYSATHKTRHNQIYRLDALDAYNQKLVKKIDVRGISLRSLTGTSAYLYLESIEISKRAPVARMEIEIRRGAHIKRVIRLLNKGDNLYRLSGELDQYKDFVVSDISAITDSVEFSNGHSLCAGEASGDVNETAMRRIQIREAIKAHLEKERELFNHGIKVLTLFFIDEVAKYRVYNAAGKQDGEYAQIFKEEYQIALDEIKQNLSLHKEYEKYLDSASIDRIHQGYFSIDKKNRRMVNPATGKRSSETNDADAYDLILKYKERLLSFNEPTRFVFSHSALREGWDNPNVFIICALKHSDSTISRRQEVGRGLRISVNQSGERQDDLATVHQINRLTVIASESYKDFVSALQRDISDSISTRPRVADAAWFEGKVIVADDGTSTEITSKMARQIYQWLVRNAYVDEDDHITQAYHDAKAQSLLSPLPEDLRPYGGQIMQLTDSVYSDAQLPQIGNDRGAKINPLNTNFHKKEFKALWNRINKKAAYSVRFDSAELIQKCVQTLNEKLRIAPLRYTIEGGKQSDRLDYKQVQAGKSFSLEETITEFETHPAHSAVEYDLIGKVADNAQLTRKTVAGILLGIKSQVFTQFQNNPENFIATASRLIQEQKATMIVEHLSYDADSETYDIDIFTEAQTKQDFSRAGQPLKRHIYDYVITDSKKERKFAGDLDVSSEVVVYAKLPKGFFIPTPVGNYNPDWAISFKEGVVKHIYFVAETKGSMSSLELRAIEKSKTECARKFFSGLNRRIKKDKVKYDIVDSYDELMEIVGAGRSP